MTTPASNPQNFASSVESSGKNLNHGQWPQLQMRDQQQSRLNSHAQRPVACETTPKFSTQWCLQFKNGKCHYGENCHFAHGIEAFSKLPFNRRPNNAAEVGENWSTVSGMKLCRWFCRGEQCPYGNRCRFLHVGLDKVKGNLGLFWKNDATDVTKPMALAASSNGCGGPRGNGSDLKCMPVVWKTRLCKKWETTRYCPYGMNCIFAHGQPEMQKLVNQSPWGSGHVLIPTSKAHIVPPKYSFRKTGTVATYEKQFPGNKSLLKWKENAKIIGIYADWIDDMPICAPNQTACRASC